MTPTYQCHKCRNKVTLENIRYDTNGTSLICEDCYSNKIKKTSLERKESSDDISNQLNHSVSKGGWIYRKPHKFNQETCVGDYTSLKNTGRIKIICTDCRYKFSIKQGSNVALRCPYCGKSRLVKDQTSVDELIKEVSEKGEVY